MLKRECEVNLGQITNCFNAFKVSKANQIYYSNCALKICSKVGGTPHILSEALFPIKHGGGSVMVIGADVSHASPMSSLPSVSAVVGSYDATCTKFFTEIRYMKGRSERILEMKECAVSLFRNFVKVLVIFCTCLL